MSALRDYGPGGVSVVFASNEPGRVEPFVFTRRSDAERAVANLRGKGTIQTVVCWHGVEIMDEQAAQRFTFGARGLR